MDEGLRNPGLCGLMDSPMGSSMGGRKGQMRFSTILSFMAWWIHIPNITSRFTHHVEHLKHLALVACTISIQHKCGCLFSEVLLCKGDASANRDLGTDDTIAIKEGQGEDVHRSTLSVGHAVWTTEKLSNDTPDGAATHDCKGVTPVCGDHTVCGGDAILETNWERGMGG